MQMRRLVSLLWRSGWSNKLRSPGRSAPNWIPWTPGSIRL